MRTKLNRTCGSREKHSENSEEGLPLAVVWQGVVEHQLLGVADEAVLCGDMEGERRAPGTTRAAGAPQMLPAPPPSKHMHLQGLPAAPPERMNIIFCGGEKAETRAATPAPSF